MEEQLAAQISAYEASKLNLAKDTEDLWQLQEAFQDVAQAEIVSLHDYRALRSNIIELVGRVSRQNFQLNSVAAVVQTLHKKAKASHAKASALTEQLKTYRKVIKWTKPKK